MSVTIAKNKRLYMLRVNNKWTQAEAATQLDIPLATYKLMEQGKQEGKPRTWLKVQKVYNVHDADMWELIKGSL